MATPDSQQPIEQISVEAFAQKQAELSPDNLQLVDVREPMELRLASLPRFQNLPLSEFGEWSPNIRSRLNPDQETLVLCHHGMRSAQMCHWLVSQGFTNVKNIAGGIDAYAAIVDQSVPRY
jgi:rhodanese-related sulfurtransferase